MFRELLIGIVAFVGVASAMPVSAQAAGYTVYIYNMRRNDGWTRTGVDKDLYTNYSACNASIQSRIKENRRNRTDFEAFAIVYTTCRPGWGKLNHQNVPCGWNGSTVYVPR
jgi:hypothetical protein